MEGAGGAPRPREYAVGWVKRGPTGLIGSNKPDAAETVLHMITDLPSLDPAPRPPADALPALLEARGVRVVDYPTWQRLDRLELARGAAQGRPRVKLCHRDELDAALAEAAAEVAP
jgi:ferredoxin--NADP+ reductase